MFWGWSEDRSPSRMTCCSDCHSSKSSSVKWIVNKDTATQEGKKLKPCTLFLCQSQHSLCHWRDSHFHVNQNPRCSLGLHMYSPLSTWRPLRLPCLCHFLVMLLRGNPVSQSAKNAFFRTHLPKFESTFRTYWLRDLSVLQSLHFTMRLMIALTSQVLVKIQNTKALPNV